MEFSDFKIGLDKWGEGVVLEDVFDCDTVFKTQL
jgi:hypothetical protein